MNIIPQVAVSMQTVLTDVADQAGRETGFIQRHRKLTGGLFVKTLVFSWLADKAASYTQMSQTAAALGLSISAQSIEDRFDEKAARTLSQTLHAAIAQMIGSQPVALPLLQRFNGTYLHDSSSWRLPDELASEFAGCGGKTEHSGLAAIKIHLRWNIGGGEIENLSITDGKTNDKSPQIELSPLSQGSLRVADLGYFCLDGLKQFSHDGIFWLTPYQVNTLIFDLSGEVIDLPRWLKSHAASEFEAKVLIGKTAQLPCRILVKRVSASEAARRRRRIRKIAKAKGRTPSATRLALADYDICLTNTPASMLTVAEAGVLYRLRWQIELLFKLFKSHGGIDQSKSEKKWRILCEIYAKLLAMIVQHWLLLCSGVICPCHSLTKAAKGVKEFAKTIALAMARQSKARLVKTLQTIAPIVKVGTRIDKRKKSQNTYQQLFAVTGTLPLLA